MGPIGASVIWRRGWRRVMPTDMTDEVREARRRWQRRAGLALLLAVAVLASVILYRRDDPAGGPVDRAREMWAHERLMNLRGSEPEQNLKSDGCSGGMSAIWSDLAEEFPALAGRIGPHPPWEACCVAHDRAYHNAGGARQAAESYRARRRADAKLRDCVANTNPAPKQSALADAMYLAVRVGGGPCSGLSWRWGYGLPNCW